MQDKYDYIVIGSGPAGHSSAIKAAELGLKVAVVEKSQDMFGGVCLNEGCIPAKSLYNSAKVLKTINDNVSFYGMKEFQGKVNISKFVEKSREAVGGLQQGLAFTFKKNNIDFITGAAEFIDNKTLKVKDEKKEFTLQADKFIIAAGSRPKVLPCMPFDGEKIITSSEAIRLSLVPESMLIVGGGAIGTEFASFFNMVGTSVTIVEMEESILPNEDKELSRRLDAIFKKRGINIHTKTSVTKASASQNGVTVTMDSNGKEISDSYDVALVCIGRTVNTDDLALDKAEVSLDDKGFIKVNGKMQTSAENIYAAGDVVSSAMLAHVAVWEGELAASAAAGEDVEPMDYSAVPNVVYTDVEIASVGLKEEETEDATVGKHFFKANGRATVTSKTEGFVKVVADKVSRKVLGAHIIGYEAGELIQEFVLAKRLGLTLEDISLTVHAHPTFSEIAADVCRSMLYKSRKA